MTTSKRTSKKTPETLDKAMTEVRTGTGTGTATRRPGRPRKPTEGRKPQGEPKDASKADTAPQDVVVFAFRLTAAERELIHNAAGRGKASWFVKTVALAVATGDSTSFEAVARATRPDSK